MNTPTDEREKQLLEKVQKLLSLATSSNPNEAALAAERAQFLIQQYNLDLSRLHKEQDGKPLILQETVQTHISHNWAKWLLNELARANFCRAIGIRGASKSYLLGEKHNIDVVQYLYEYCYRELRRLAREAYREQGSTLPYSTYLNSFATAAIHVLVARLQQQSQQFAEAQESRALVVVTDTTLNEALNKAFPNRNKLRLLQRGYKDAVDAGHEAGRGLHLRAGVGGAGEQRSLPSPH